MKRNAFTLIELIAVIVILGIILAIAIPTITGVIKSSAKRAFESDAKMVLKGIDYKRLENETFDPTIIDKSNIYELLGIADSNYKDVMITLEDDTPIISIIGNDKWDGFIACGTYQNMKVVENASNCDVDAIPPVITILGDNPVNIYIGSIYIDAGATATDNLAGDVTDDIIVTGTVNPNIEGTYTITYLVKDIFNNQALATRTINVIDNAYPMITFNPNGNSTYGKTRSTAITATDLGLLDNSSLKYAWTTSTIEPSSDIFTNVYASGQIVNTPIGVTGNYYLWAVAIDTSNNKTVSRSNVFNLDNTKPVIILNGNNNITISKGNVYIDAGSIATDNVDTSVVVTSTGSVNPNVVGTYTITYNATDSSGNIATSVTRTVMVVDVSAPVITLNGSNPTNISVGATYIDAGATAIDDVDGNVTSKIITTGTVNPNVAGTYTITYTVKDNANNTSVLTRTVNVIVSTYAFPYTGSFYTFTVPVTGIYKLEVWGAQGGGLYNGTEYGGLGGYATGEKALTAGEVLSIYVGGKGMTGSGGTSGQGGYNGGGGSSSYTGPSGGGGGGTDIRYSGTALTNRIIVAGGGGGSGYYSSTDAFYTYGPKYGGSGGGTTGENGASLAGSVGGSQTSGGYYRGTLGVGGTGDNVSEGGGGGGYYGGGTVGGSTGSGGGGSGYIGGVSNGTMSNGVRSNNGYAVITYLGQ
jgi:prepilin-type N-terminal cleavage/methylation domain-containing protein